METHISWVLLTGQYAFKIKKAVDLGFLDFTTLDARRHFCEREVVLNRRFAPAIYLDVVAITGSEDAPHIAGSGPAIEYAVRMKEFPQEALLSRVLKRGDLSAANVDALARAVAEFHRSADADAPDRRFGSPAAIRDLAIENFTELEPLLEEPADRRILSALRRWTDTELARRNADFERRHADGSVRDCHGDLHLGNIALVDGAAMMFDCLEFNDAMRWSDVMADVGFLAMDLEDRGRADFAARFRNAYFERTGDYDGTRVLRFYEVYRAMVRAKVAAMRAQQTTDAVASDSQLAECRGYLALARAIAERGAPMIFITYGPSGAGKTTGSQPVMEQLGAIRVRLDVERKRLHGLDASASSGSRLNEGLYSPANTDRAYRRAADLATTVAKADYPAIVDATFLRRRHRELLHEVAANLQLPFGIIDFTTDAETLRDRVAMRQAEGRDASEADIDVLEYQLKTTEPLTLEERQLTITAADLMAQPRRPCRDRPQSPSPA